MITSITIEDVPPTMQDAQRFYLFVYKDGHGTWGKVEDWLKLNTEEWVPDLVAVFAFDYTCEYDQFDFNRLTIKPKNSQ